MSAAQDQLALVFAGSVGVPDERSVVEHAALVARGVRMIATVGECGSDRGERRRVMTLLLRHQSEGLIAFMVRGPGRRYAYGFARHRWALDTYRWVLNAAGVPAPVRAGVLGLLHGYSGEAVRDYCERC